MTHENANARVGQTAMSRERGSRNQNEGERERERPEGVRIEPGNEFRCMGREIFSSSLLSLSFRVFSFVQLFASSLILKLESTRSQGFLIEIQVKSDESRLNYLPFSNSND